jgi:putative DNA primase/helicase
MSETLLNQKAQDVLREIRGHIEAFLPGGPNTRAEDLERAAAHGLTEEITALWERAEAKRPRWIGRLDGLPVLGPEWLAEGRKIVREGLATREEVAAVAEARGWSREEALEALKAKRRVPGPFALSKGAKEAKAEWERWLREAARAQAAGKSLDEIASQSEWDVGPERLERELEERGLFICLEIQPKDEGRPSPKAEVVAEVPVAVAEPGRALLDQLGLRPGAGVPKAAASALLIAKSEFSLVESPSGFPSTYINARIGVQKLCAKMNRDIRYDMFHDRLIVGGFECSGSGDVTENLDNVALKIRDGIISEYKFDPGKNHVHDAIVSLGLERTFDPVKDYLDSLQWDGKPRLDTWLIAHLGVADTPLNRAIGRKMLIAGVRRVRKPGCKFDYIVVLEGEQGSGRSTALKILAGGDENFSDAEVISLYPKERQEQVQGVWIYELAELAGYGKVDINKFKNFVSQTVDRARPAYGRNRIDRPRRCIFVATTNDDEYLRDHTGNRRYWPVKLPRGFRIDLARLREARDQLWAEASVAEGAVDANGAAESLVIPEVLWPEAAAQQALRMESDPWEDRLRDLLVDGAPNLLFAGYIDGTQADLQGEPEWRIATSDLLKKVLDISPHRQFTTHMKRLAGVMRKLGWTKPEGVIRINKKPQNGYRRPKGM